MENKRESQRIFEGQVVGFGPMLDNLRKVQGNRNLLWIWCCQKVGRNSMTGYSNNFYQGGWRHGIGDW